MNKQEFMNIVKAITTMYPDTIKEDNYTYELWFRLLSDLSYEQVSMALHKHMQSSVYPPKVADLRKGAVEITDGYRESGNEVWQRIDNIVRYRLPIGMPECRDVAQEEFEKLPTPARRLLGNSSRLIEMATEYTMKDFEVAKASFVRDYHAEDARDLDIKALRDDVRQTLIGTTQRKAIAKNEN